MVKAAVAVVDEIYGSNRCFLGGKLELAGTTRKIEGAGARERL